MSDAEDVARRRCCGSRAGQRIDEPAAWIATVATLSTGVLLATRRRRETYVRPRAPEPLVATDGGA